jgi:hypothetical protein
MQQVDQEADQEVLLTMAATLDPSTVITVLAPTSSLPRVHVALASF